MTGLWQVSGRNDVDYATRTYLDLWYVKNWSLCSDIAILFKTISVVIGHSGADLISCARINNNYQFFIIFTKTEFSYKISSNYNSLYNILFIRR